MEQFGLTMLIGGAVGVIAYVIYFVIKQRIQKKKEKDNNTPIV